MLLVEQPHNRREALGRYHVAVCRAAHAKHALGVERTQQARLDVEGDTGASRLEERPREQAPRCCRTCDFRAARAREDLHKRRCGGIEHELVEHGQLRSIALFTIEGISQRAGQKRDPSAAGKLFACS